MRSALKKFFAEEQPGDSQYALMALGRSLHVVVDSTRDPQTILTALESKSLLKTIHDSDASNVAFEVDRFARLVGHWCGGCQCNNPLQDAVSIDGAHSCVGLKQQVEASAFYTIDSRGLYTHAEIGGTGLDASSAGVPVQAIHAAMSTIWFNGDAMSQLARETGGQFFENSNDFLNGIRTAFADGREEYELAYIPSDTNMDGRFRKIVVEVKNKKLQVAAKAGYWAIP